MEAATSSRTAYPFKTSNTKSRSRNLQNPVLSVDLVTRRFPIYHVNSKHFRLRCIFSTPPFPILDTTYHLCWCSSLLSLHLLMIDHLPYIPPLCRFLIFFIQTTSPQTMSSNNPSLRIRISLQLCPRASNRSSHPLPRRPPTNRPILLRKCGTTILYLHIPVCRNRCMVVV